MKKKFSEKGAKGFGFGELDQTDRDFLKPDFDTKRQVGEKAVGMFATAANPLVVTDDSNDD